MSGNNRDTEGDGASAVAQDDPRTVFVRGLDVSVGDEQLIEAFSSIGPVKHAFTVKRKDGSGHQSQHHKGFGFVQFALEDDAVRSVHELHGTRLNGRVIKVERAHKRASFEERKKVKVQSLKADDGDATEKKESPKKKENKKPRADVDVKERQKKHDLVRTIAIGGLTRNDVDGAIEFAKSLGKVEEVTDPVPEHIARKFHLEQDGCTGEAILVRYSSVKEALAAMKGIHRTQKKLNPSKKALAVTMWARQVSGEGKHLKKYRVVVRNLPFNVTETDLREAFESIGMIWEVTMPRDAEGHSRGFAFVGFTCKTDTDKAISKVNATKIAGRVVAVDFAVSKRDFQAKEDDTGGDAGKVRNDSKKDTIIPGQDFLEEEEEIEIDPAKEKNIMSSVLDDILSSKKDKDDSESESESGSDDDDDEEEEEEEDDAASTSSDDDLEENNHLNNEKRQKVVDEVNKKAAMLQQAIASDKKEKEPYHVEPGATVFIRNLPVDITQKTVFQAMKKFGFVQSTRLVLNKSTRKPKGTAFVDFRSVESANSAAEASKKASDKMGPPVIIAGKPVEIHIALGGDDIRDLAIRKREGLDTTPVAPTGDRRNLYLAKEGVIVEGSAAWNQLSSSDKTKRARAMQESMLKLKSPNFAVSRTRLNVRNVPKTWDESKLKNLFIKAVQRRATKETPKVAQVKILRETSELGTSKGIAFIEFKGHDHALCALRELNNNPDIWGKDHRPIIEFAIDNVQALRKREIKLQRQKLAAAGELPEKPDKAEKKKKKKKEETEEAKSKRKLKMERRAMLKQRQRSMQGKTAKEDTPAQKTKSQRRREQRKKIKDVDMKAIDTLASSGIPASDQVVKKRSTKRPTLEDRVERGMNKRQNPLKDSGKRWFDE
jgi:nucleolar protein 4